jgi:UDP-glucose 4-epimerase
MDGDTAHPLDGAEVLVTGGAGFIGSHLTDRLLAAGARVTVIDDLSTGRRGNLPHEGPSLRLILDDLARALDDLDLGIFQRVFHLAATVGVQRVIERPAHAIENNVGHTALLFHRLSALADPPRVLFASSSEVYGKSPDLPFRESDDLLLGPTTAPRWSYAASKALGEHLALAHHQTSGLPVVIARLFNTVGPRQVGAYGMVLPRFVAAAVRREPLTVHGDGAQSRCFCDVRDVAPALVELSGRSAATGRVFNVGSDQPITIADLARLVNAVVGSDAGFVTAPYDRVLGPNFEDLRHRVPDLARIREAIGFRPTIPLERTISDLERELAGAEPRMEST